MAAEAATTELFPHRSLLDSIYFDYFTLDDAGAVTAGNFLTVTELGNLGINLYPMFTCSSATVLSQILSSPESFATNLVSALMQVSASSEIPMKGLYLQVQVSDVTPELSEHFSEFALQLALALTSSSADLVIAVDTLDLLLPSVLAGLSGVHFDALSTYRPGDTATVAALLDGGVPLERIIIGVNTSVPAANYSFVFNETTEWAGRQLNASVSGLSLFPPSADAFPAECGWWYYLTFFLGVPYHIPLRWSFLYEPAALFILLTALALLVLGSWRASRLRLELGALGRDIEENNTISLRLAIGLPILASVSLIVLFYLLDSLTYLLLILMGLMVLMSVTFVSFSPFVYLVKWLKIRGTKVSLTSTEMVTLPRLGPLPVAIFFGLGFAAVMITLWITVNHWIILDLLGGTFCVYALTLVRLPNLKLATILLVGYLCLDVFFVFLSGYIFGESVMISVARKATGGGSELSVLSRISLPLLLQYPILLPASDDVCVSSSASMLGLGDVVLPGFLVTFLYLEDRRAKRTSFLGGGVYFLRVLLGYTAGLLLAFVMVHVLVNSWSGQPALLYLVPGTLVPTLLTAYQRGELAEMWLKPKRSRSEELAETAQEPDAAPLLGSGSHSSDGSEGEGEDEGEGEGSPS